MPLLVVLQEIFPKKFAPYTLREITERLESTIEPQISYGRVHRAFATLSSHDSTKDIVQPLDDSERYYQFSADAAQRIARKALSRKIAKILRDNQNQSRG